MKDEELQRLCDLLVTGDIAADDHATLQQKLKTDAEARATFRERMDLEAGLRTWASEPVASLRISETNSDDADRTVQRSSAMRWNYTILAVAAVVLLVVGASIWNNLTDTDPKQLAEDRTTEQSVAPPAATRLVGVIREQEGCQWSVRPVSTAGRFAIGKLELSKGIAKLSFDSGTDVTLEGPCEIDITSIDGARLLVGNVCVNVSELSGGFTLETPESQIIDEGTEYAVSLDEEAAEIHVFDGSVLWIPTATESEVNDQTFEDRIEAGEARSYLRSDPTMPKRIPFGQRQFVRRLEDRLKTHAGGELVAYDGFENLAGRVRRGRSGFGWSGGWQLSGRSRGKIGEIIDCGDEVVFGLDRSQRRLMFLEQGSDIRRGFDQPLDLVTGESIYVSVLIERQSSSSEEDKSFLQISLEPDLPGRGRRLHQIVSFGVATDGFPFITSGDAITKTATRLVAGETVFCVLKLAINGDKTSPSVRVYRYGEVIDESEPSAWTVTGRAGSTAYAPASLRIIVGENASWQIDELKIGRTWDSVAKPGRQ
ncbi:FecR protein [Rhodopirellula maiorica SM1]|uniref:FecR protein n=1 Tax=Rhodopirellula maiorica SM1 TaxID=1265738 RepID=M5RE98_9BACT|nr:FecR domain-containing protein [Rhodopirellula maiorica]EMI17705.1 FecR protein [Rhodopirellula maiorica SM1]